MLCTLWGQVREIDFYCLVNNAHFFFIVVELHLNVATINLSCCQAVDCIDALALSSCLLKLQQAAVY